MSEKYLKQIDKKMDRLLEIAEQFAEKASVQELAEKASVQEEPFYYQTSAAAAPIPETESVNFEINEAPVAKSSKVNNWNKFVSEVLSNMKSSNWKNPNTGKPATRKNAMKEASRRKAEANPNYAATAVSRRAKRNKALASKAANAAAIAAFNAAGAPAATANFPAATANLPAVTANLPAATAANVVNAPYKGPPRKGIDPPPSIYKKFKGPSVPGVFSPNGPNSRQSVTHAVERLESLLQNSTMPADKRAKLEKQLVTFKGKLAAFNAAGAPTN